MVTRVSLKDPKYKIFRDYSASIKKFHVVLYTFRRSYKHLLEKRSRFGEALAKLTNWQRLFTETFYVD